LLDQQIKKSGLCKCCEQTPVVSARSVDGILRDGARWQSPIDEIGEGIRSY
jgi:hypothetical protein